MQEMSSEKGYNLVRKQIPRENQSIASVNTEESPLPPRVTYVSFKSKISVNIRKKKETSTAVFVPAVNLVEFVSNARTSNL